MPIRTTFLCIAFLSLLGGLAAASPLSEATDKLNGDWRGKDFVLRIDADRAQASIDPQRPFSWQRFMIKEIDEDEVVFSIGAELYQARIDAETLTLTGTSFRGAKVLFRDDNIRGTLRD